MGVMQTFFGRIVATGLMLLWLPGEFSAWADQVHLTNGQTIEGIVAREADSQVVLQVAWEGYVVLDRPSIAAIDAANDKQRKQLLGQWHEEYLAFQERDRKNKAFEARQLARGLVLHQGQWVTPEELTAMKAQAKAAEEEHRKRQEAEERLRNEQQERKAREEELQALTERIRTMQLEQLRLQQEISSLKYLLVRPDFLLETGTQFVRDAQGNLLRVKRHDGHLFVVPSDGAHADLQVHGDHLSFTDRQGTHHDVDSTR